MENVRTFNNVPVYSTHIRIQYGIRYALCIPRLVKYYDCEN